MMGGNASSHLMWRDRFEEVQLDFNRVETLLKDDLDAQIPDLGGRFSVLLSQLKSRLDAVKDKASAPDSDSLWTELAAVRAAGRQAYKIQLELLGGLALRSGVLQVDDPQNDPLDAGRIAQAESWLDAMRASLGLARKLVVFAGMGPELDLGMGVVRLPFLDWDLWRLPLLGRALGLLAAAEDASRGGHLASVVEPLLGEAASRFSGGPGAQSELRQHLHHLFADMFATAVFGPVYAMSVFTLELDYAFPERYSPQDPYQDIEDQAVKLFLPTPVERAAAILAVLRQLDAMQARPPKQLGPYTRMIEDLQGIWTAAVLPQPGEDTLESIAQRFQDWHQALFQVAILGQSSVRVDDARKLWANARSRFRVWCGESGIEAPELPLEGAERLAELLTAGWLFILRDPSHQEMLASVVPMLLSGESPPLPQPGEALPALPVVLQLRLGQLERRWERLERCLKSEQIPLEDRLAVAGRFYRLLSRQVYWLERDRKRLLSQPVVPQVWQEFANLESEARPLQREALEFLGGVEANHRKLDRESAALTGGAPGPSICSLATRLLLGYSTRTGINWKSRAILGEDPFLEPDTEVIRVRFPDWSIWNLPLMAHEFGHLAAGNSPDFRRYQQEAGVQAFQKVTGDHSEEAVFQQVIDHIEELFADLFAVYTLGPAFACDAVLLQFDPLGAFTPRQSHPAHDQRVQAILQALEVMNAATRQKPKDPGDYATVLRLLRERWQEALKDCGTTGGDEVPYQEQLARCLQWAKDLYQIIDSSYRLGAAYTPKRWAWAQQTAARLLPDPPSLEEVSQDAGEQNLGQESLLDDLLNALWWLRLQKPEINDALTRVALQLCQGIAT